MSIEQALAENTAALHALTAVLGKLGIAPPAQIALPVDASPKVEKPKVEKPKAEKAAPAVLDYALVGAAITSYAAVNGREAALAKLATLNVKSGKELKPEQYAAALALFAGEAVPA